MTKTQETKVAASSVFNLTKTVQATCFQSFDSLKRKIRTTKRNLGQ